MSDFKTFVALGMPAPLAKEVDKGIQNGGANAVQKDGGDASNTVVKAEGALVARVASARAADALHVNDFGLTGTINGDTAAFIAADAAVAGVSEAAVVGIAPGTTVTGDESAALFAANRTIVKGHGELKNFLRKQANRDYLPTPWMFAPTVTARHLNQTRAAAVTGTIRVAVMGDSIFNRGSNIISQAAMPVQVMIDEIEKQNPGVKVQIFDYSIAGKNWNDMWADSSAPPPWYDNANNLNWKQFVAVANPDLLLLYSGGNDGYGFNVSAMQNLVKYFQTAANFSSGNIPDLIFGITYQPSVASPVVNYNTADEQNGILYCSTYVRNYAITYGYGYLDFARWHAMCRDGIDPREIAMPAVQPNSGTTFPALDGSVPLDVNNKWIFPEAKTKNGVSADNCTDWIAAFTVETANASIIAPMSAKSGNGDAVNNLFIIPRNGNIYVSIQDGVNGDVISEQTNIPWPTGQSVWTVMLQGGRAVVWYQTGLTNGWSVSGQDNIRMGMGMTMVFDHQVPRFGGPYTPYIQFGGTVPVSVQILCVGDVTNIQSSGNRCTAQRFSPIVSDYELYVQDDSDAGGSGAYHMNAYGVRMILAPVIRAQQWGVVTSMTANLNTINPSNEWLDVLGGVQAEKWGKFKDYVQSQKSITQWGASALTAQPSITGAAPTDPIVKQLLSLGAAYGLWTDGTTSTTTTSSSTVTSGGTVTSSTTNG
ncbi:hypothetical protein ACE4RV_02885 [Acetobacter persici]|uniref:hypothetical protein n=1 Tax=Acetobacter persici TaxID=1076596 RepID=UPI0036D7853C